MSPRRRPPPNPVRCCVGGRRREPGARSRFVPGVRSCGGFLRVTAAAPPSASEIAAPPAGHPPGRRTPAPAPSRESVPPEAPPA